MVNMKLLPKNFARGSKSYVPFVPMDWIFTAFPYSTRDKMRFFYRYGQICSALAFTFMYGWWHPPYKGHHGIPKNARYYRKEAELDKSGLLYENARIKRHSLYDEEKPEWAKQRMTNFIPKDD